MSFIYKNPLSSTQVGGESSVQREDNFGTNFSVLQVGGYMEVYYLNDLDFTVVGTGNIQFSGNTIPINYNKRNLPFLPDTLTLNSDNISSGRRRLGMLVYVHETELTYQYTIDNFESLWLAASGGTTQSDFGSTVSTNGVGGTPFINAWLDSSIEGVSGVTRANARWRVFYGTDITVTGGTYSSGTGVAQFKNSTGGTFNVTGFTTGGSGSYTSWFAEGDNQTPATPIDVVDTFTLKFTGAITSGGAGIATDSAISANEMTIALINNGGSPTDKTFYRGDGEWQSPTDTELTGGTYNNGTGTVELKNSDGSVVTLTGFTTGTTEDTYVTGMSYSQVTKALTLGLNDGVDFTANGFAAEVTGGIYNIGGTITLNNNDGTTSTITGLGAINTNIYTDDGTLQGDRVVDQDTRHLTFSGGTGVSMGTGTTSPVCALLELASENQGLLIPRMTQAQRLNVSTPKPGLLLYCLDSTGDGEEGLYMYKSIGWVNVL
jgi:hypothetical protein